MRIYTTTIKKDDSGVLKAFFSQSLNINESLENTLEVEVNPNLKYQQIDGFGVSITEATSYLYNNFIADKNKFMKDSFDNDKGIGLSFLRQPIGPTDHVSTNFAFLDKEKDLELKSLNFNYEIENMLPMIKEAFNVSKSKINIMVSAWSAPSWMKENNSILGIDKETCVPGFLKKQYYEVYAKYLVAFIEMYKNHGINVMAITPVNEPDFANYVWPSMPMKSLQQKEFIVNYLYPQLQKYNLDTKIICWDHNFDSFNYLDGQYVIDILEDPQARNIIDGSAWHWYVGSPNTMTKIKNLYPEKGIWITEASGGEWGYKQWQEAFSHQSKMNIEMLNNYAQSIVYWNLALDTNGGPDYFYQKNQKINSQNRGLFTVDRKNQSYSKNVDYYTLGHFSKFISIGSVRINTNNLTRHGIHHTSFLTPNNEIITVIYNANPKSKNIRLKIEDISQDVEIEGLSLNTIVSKVDLKKETHLLEFQNIKNLIAPDDLNLQWIDHQHGKKGLRVIIESEYLKETTGEILISLAPDDINIDNYNQLVILGENLRYYEGKKLSVSFYTNSGSFEKIDTLSKLEYDCPSKAIIKLNDLKIDLKTVDRIGISFYGQERDIFIIYEVYFC